jgi:hypothetical protein
MTLRLFLLLAGVIFVTGSGWAAHAQEARPICSLPKGRAYTLGTTIVHQERFYRCLRVFGPDMKEAGVAWVEVEKSAARWVTPRTAR